MCTSALSSPMDWILRYTKTYLYLPLLIPYQQLIFQVCLYFRVVAEDLAEGGQRLVNFMDTLNTRYYSAIAAVTGATKENCFRTSRINHIINTFLYLFIYFFILAY